MEVFVVTGCSGGFGEAFVSSLIAQEKENTQILLISRSPCNLFVNKPNSCKAELFYSSIDLSELDHLPEKFTDALNQLSSNVTKATLVNNAASLGPIMPMSELTDYKLVQKTIDLNITSLYILNSIFLRRFANSKKTIVEISSGAAIIPMGGWSLYCANKSARMMLSKVLANETELAGDSTKYLSYSPGIMATKMQVELKNIEQPNKWTSFPPSVVDSGKAVPLEVTAGELLSLLENGDFKSGDFVELYSRRPEFAPF